MVRCLVPLLPVLTVCLVTVQLLSPCSADFAVLGPPEPILVMVGEDTHLPCHLSPKMNAETMDLMWVRPSLRQVVHKYAHRQEGTPAEEYRGRTSVLREDVTVGKAALQIRNVSASDNGTYLCYFQDRDFYAKAQVELQVAALGSYPHIKMKAYEAGGVRVTCMSAGWYPPPQIEWRDARGQKISNGVVTEAADPQGLYAASASVVLEEGSEEEVSCVIRNPLLGQERSARLSIPGPFFRNTELLMAFILPVLVALAVLLLVVLYCLWRRQKRIQAPSQKKGRDHEVRQQWCRHSSQGWEAPKRSCRTSSSQGGTLSRAILPLPRDAGRSSPAPGMDTIPLLEQQGTAMAPSEDPEARFQLQEVVSAGGGASPEQALQTQMPPGTRTRLGQEPSMPRSSHE
ncbi:butyrophilin subfamily 3 member A2-like isoform X5 [Sturnira hondurensis]|uniref:butyrophilin subfamily 3 member A2-like isoform X5 n=1 Tax=Sturnira hondurensis TaxID=192404 RepID=UPI001879DF75|nr:butyrophilin subfamily 3 member A2-like isoform X5 [Sturnira hondurensis]